MTAGTIEVLARAAIVVERRALLVRSKGAANTFLPGGHVELGEPIAVALRRELDEEMGVSCTVAAPLGVVEHTWRDDENRARFEVNHVFRVHLSSADVTSKEPALEIVWAALDTLDDVNLQPAPMRAILRLAAEGARGEAFAARIHECTYAPALACDVRRVRSDDAERLRNARLYALAETPTAFGATLARDLAQSDDAWLAWAEERTMGNTDASAKPARRATFVADDGDALRGTITIAEGDDDPTRAHVFAMWVHPSQRRTALATRLVDEALSWARDNAFQRVSLAVTTNNTRARRLYERLGFVATGATWPLKHAPSLSLHEMSRVLS
jgi:8-oxo-dGTP diphosphatase